MNILWTSIDSIIVAAPSLSIVLFLDIVVCWKYTCNAAAIVIKKFTISFSQDNIILSK